MSTADTKGFITRRSSFKASLTVYKNFLAKHEQDPDPDALVLRLNRLKDLFTIFDEAQRKLEDLQENDTTLEAQCNERLAVEETYFDLITMTEKLLRQSRQAQSQHLRESPTSSNGTSNGLKLPEVSLPKFDGKVEHWLSFQEQFTSLIDNQVNLSSVQKLHYLRSAVTGDAANLLASLDVSDDSYTLAWELLKTNYANKRLVVMRHLDLLSQTPHTQKNAASTLRQFCNHVRQHIRALKMLQIPIVDVIVIHNLLPKLDKDTRIDFETSLEIDELPALDKLLNFLLSKARCLEAAEPTMPKPHFNLPINQRNSETRKADPQKSRQTFTTIAQTGCPLCKTSTHRIYDCEELHKLSTSDRIQTVRQAFLCLNCLRRGHGVTQCRSIRCRICDQPHHTLLHINEQPVTTAENHED